MDTHYTFGTSANSYYNGHDLRIRWEDRSLGIVVNEKDGLLAFDVKDHDTFHNLPLGAQAAGIKIGDEATQRIYEQVQHDFWQWAGEACKDHGFETVFQAGRSGGWLAVAGTENLTGEALIEPGEEDEDLRDRFLAFGFEIEQAIENEGGFKQQFYAALIEAGKEYREPVDCPNCGNEIDPQHPTTGHGESCLLSAMIDVLIDRGHTIESIDISKVDTAQLWTRFGGPATDWVAEQIGLAPYPSEQSEIVDSLASEFTENGLTDLAERLRKDGIEAARRHVESEIADARENDDPEGWRLGNLEVAQQRLEESGLKTFGELELSPFQKDADANFPDNTLYLYELEDGALFEDAQGRLFNRVGHGPVQGSVEIVDDDKVHAYWDVTTRVRRHESGDAKKGG